MEKQAFFAYLAFRRTEREIQEHTVEKKIFRKRVLHVNDHKKTPQDFTGAIIQYIFAKNKTYFVELAKKMDKAR